MGTYKIAISSMALDGKIPNGDPRWEDFTKSFVRREIELVDLIDAIYKGHSYTAWHDGRRKNENFICSQFVAVDMDTMDKRSTIDELRSNKFFRLYGALIHATPSHTTTAPRARCIFLLDEPIHNVSGYKLAIETVSSFFPGHDPSCIDASKFFYGNCNLQSEPDGLFVDSGKVLPLDHLRPYARQLRVRQQNEMKADHRQYQATAPKAQTRNDNAPSLDEIASELLRVDPYSVDYTTWFKALAALKHEYGDAAFGVAKQWSDTPGKKPLTQRKWQSIDQNHPETPTIATLRAILSGQSW